MLEEKYLISAAELAERWHTNIYTVNRMFKDGRLTGFKVGNKWMTEKKVIEAYENGEKENE